MLHVVDQNGLLRQSEQKTVWVIHCCRFASEYWISEGPVTLLVTLLGIMKNTVKLYLLYICSKYNTLSHNCNISCKVPKSCPYFYINVCACAGRLFYIFYHIDKCPSSKKLLIALETIATPTLGCSLSLLPVVFGASIFNLFCNIT